jgi:pyrroline-5-carboxylate reductase
MNKKIGFIGCGKMASAIIKGISGMDGLYIKGSESNLEILNKVKTDLNIEVINDNNELVKDSDIIFIATKPNQVSGVLEEIKDTITSDKLIVSIAAGVKLESIEKIIGNQRIIRIMPNTPALVREGMFGVCKNSYATAADVELILSLLKNIGKYVEIQESQIDIVTAISGSGPAFFYQIFEDMARAGEKLGLDYEKSLLLAVQTAIGSAKMVLNRQNTSVQTLIDNVATKGGCTFVGIETMKNFESDKFFNDVIKNTTEKARQLG